MPWTKKAVLLIAFYLRLPVIALSLGRTAYIENPRVCNFFTIFSWFFLCLSTIGFFSVLTIFFRSFPDLRRSFFGFF
jgi:hypothetical protein